MTLSGIILCTAQAFKDRKISSVYTICSLLWFNSSGKIRPGQRVTENCSGILAFQPHMLREHTEANVSPPKLKDCTQMLPAAMELLSCKPLHLSRQQKSNPGEKTRKNTEQQLFHRPDSPRGERQGDGPFSTFVIIATGWKERGVCVAGKTSTTW